MQKQYFIRLFPNNSIQGLICLTLAQVMVGLNIVVSKGLFTYFPVLILLEIRFLIATIVLLPLHCVTPKKHSLKFYLSDLKCRDWCFIVAQSLCAGILFNFFMLTGLNYTDANVSGIITSALPALIALMSWIFLREKISSQKLFCIFFATLGLLVIACDKFNGINAEHSFLGDGIVLLALIPEASYYVLCKVYTNRLPVFLTSSLLNGINALLLLPVFFFINWDLTNINSITWLTLLLISVSSGLFYVFWFIGAQKVDGVMTSISTGIMPIATVVLARFILGEELTTFAIFGMGLVLFSIIFYAKK
jgi:drug/metabolite transporter (DMT)-like permease